MRLRLPGAEDLREGLSAARKETAMEPDRDEELEVYAPPRFLPGSKVRATKYVMNDGTFPGREIGEVLVRKGDLGYVRDIGTFLQRFHVYAVEFVDRGAVVGMRARELVAVEEQGA
jgi:nitrogen fixation protein NifZ